MKLDTSLYKSFPRDPHHLASGPVAPLFASAVLIHCFLQSDHLYLSAQKMNIFIH